MNGRATPEALAELVAAKLRPVMRAEIREAVEELRQRPVEPLVSAKELAARYGHSARWWRDHKDEFGGIPRSDGPRPRIDFDPAHVERVLASRRL